MDSFITSLTKLISNPEYQPLLENLKKQNEKFMEKETSKLLNDDDDSDDDPDHPHADDSEDEDLEAATGKEVAMSILTKLSKLFQYTSVQDKCLLFIGTIFTAIHAASFPILAILFGKISNAYIAHQLLEMKNTTLHPPHAHNNQSVGATGQLALSLLTKVTSKVNPGMNASVIPTAESVSGGGYFGDINPYKSNGTETIDDFATYVAEFSMYYVYIGIAVFISSFIQTATWEWVAETQLYRIKQKYIYQLMRQDLTWFGRHTAGNLVLKMADDCERFREGVGHKFSLVIEYIAIALLGAGIGLLTNTKLTLVFLASAPFILTKLFVLWKKIAVKSARAQKEYAKAAKICSEVFTSVKTVASFSGERKEVKRYKAALAKGSTAAERMELLVGIGIGGMYFLIYAFYAVALWYSVNLLAEGVITAGEIYTVFFSLTICAFALGSLLPYVNSIATSFASIKILEDVLDSVPSIDPYSQTGDRPKNFSGKIKFSNVKFAYPGREGTPVFTDLKLEIPGTGTVAIVGQCSSGKSSLVNLLLRFYDPQKGQIRFDNYDIKTLNLRWVRGQIAVIEQNADIHPVTIFDTIRSFRKEITIQSVIKAAKLALCHDFIMGLPKKYMTRLSLPGGKDLSIGQRQRIVLASCFLRNSKILIMDEAMSAIDVSDALIILRNLARIRKGSTTIVLAHKLAVARNADIIFVLKNGNANEKGNHEELMKLKGEYFQMVQHENLVDQMNRERRASSNDPATTAESETERELIAEHMSHGSRGATLEKSALKLKKATDAARDSVDEIPSIRKVLNVMPQGIWMLYLGIFGCLLSGLVIPILSLCLGQILNMFLGDKEDLFAAGIFWVEILVCLAVLAGIGYCCRTVCIGIVGEKLTQGLRLASYESILRQPVSWFDFEDNTPAFLYSRLASDIPFIRNAVGPRLGTAFSALMTLTTGLLIATIYGWQLALISAIIIPVLIAGFCLQRRALMRSHKKLTVLRKVLITMTNAIVRDIIQIQANSSALGRCQYAESLSIFPALIEGQTRASAYALAYATSEGLMFLTFGAAFRLGAELIRQGVLSISDLFTVFFVITFGSLTLGQATSFIPEYFKARISSSSIMHFVDMKSTVDPFDPSGLKPEIVGKIEFRNVVFSYPILPTIKILDGLNLTIPPGEVIGIAGPVGGGKSTILAILQRFYEIESGQVLIDGVDIRDINLNYLRDKLGYVPQESTLFDITIRENILYGYHGDVVGNELQSLVEKSAMAADADFIIELPKQLETKCGEQGKNLNPGQRQEIAIARTVIRNSPIILLDDPTSALDSEEEARAHVAMMKAMKGRTGLLVSNSYATIRHCNYIAFLVQGRIAEFGRQEDLLEAKGYYYKFVLEQGINFQQGTKE